MRLDLFAGEVVFPVQTDAVVLGVSPDKSHCGIPNALLARARKLLHSCLSSETVRFFTVRKENHRLTSSVSGARFLFFGSTPKIVDKHKL